MPGRRRAASSRGESCPANRRRFPWRRHADFARGYSIPAPTRTAEPLARGLRRAIPPGKAVEKTIVVGNDGGDARLLQHHFGDPDAVGVAAGAPRKIAAMLSEPGEQTGLNASGERGSGE